MRYIARRRKSGGQTLIIAIMIMFILAIVATLFIAIVARNLYQAGRSSSADAVMQIAQAGVNYADHMLTSSEDGADWRPAPDNVGCSDCGDLAKGTEPTPDSNWKTMRDQYPDYKWLRPYWPKELGELNDEGVGYAGPTGGYTCYNSGQGRFLLRVSYNPNMSDPLSKYIKIESVGRWGIFDKDDPTTYKDASNYKLRRELTAYKPIGVTDYLRFVTNKNNKPLVASLGVPNYSSSYGRDSSTRYGLRGAPIRVNGDLKWYGIADGKESVSLYLRGVESDDNTSVIPLDRVEVSGDISSDVDSTTNNKVVVGVNSIVNGKVTKTYAEDSSSNNFTTASGFYRDGNSATDKDKNARGVKRIEPPLVDKKDLTNTSTRYRLLTFNSGERIKVNGKTVNTGKYGWGRGVYIDNSNDDQSDSFSLFGRYSLREDWLNPNNNMSKSAWFGPYYIPPAVTITLVPDDSENVSYNGNSYKQYYFYITKDTSTSDYWYDASGNERPDWGRTIRMPYPDPNNGRIITTAQGASKETFMDANGVIYAEGNVRVRGMLPPGMDLTIVSNRTIYIDGNVLKYRENNPNSSDAYRGADSSCGLALLAKDNICVNTTQFCSPDNVSVDQLDSSAGDASSPTVIVNQNSDFRTRFEFGPYESETGNSSEPGNRYLMLRHAGQGGVAYINMFLNKKALELNNKVTTLYSLIWGVGDSRFNAYGWGTGTALIGQVFDLTTSSLKADLYTLVGKTNLLSIALDKMYLRNDYALSRLAVVPNDIRIEAVMYAQEGSFFIIPGRWFNEDSSDISSNSKRNDGVDTMFPYYGEPLDIRIIVDGAISENVPAAVGDASQWMEKWSNIPQYYGSSNKKTAHPGEGVTFLYDDHAGWPLKDLNNPDSAIRRDRYGRPLPIAPRLPVCGSLIYSGDVM